MSRSAWFHRLLCVAAAQVELRVDGQAGAGGGRGDALHHDLVAGQRSAAPVHRDVAEQAMLDPVPLCVQKAGG